MYEEEATRNCLAVQTVSPFFYLKNFALSLSPSLLPPALSGVLNTLTGKESLIATRRAILLTFISARVIYMSMDDNYCRSCVVCMDQDINKLLWPLTNDFVSYRQKMHQTVSRDKFHASVQPLFAMFRHLRRNAVIPQDTRVLMTLRRRQRLTRKSASNI